MVEAGVREVKDRLSEYLRKVKAGEEVVITEHGRPVAKLSRVAAAPVRPAWLERMIARGEIIPGTGGMPRGSNIRMRGEGPTISDIIIQHRQERHDSLVGLIGTGKALSGRTGKGSGTRSNRKGRSSGGGQHRISGNPSGARRRPAPAAD
jgi:prevent-host-death family protein